MNDTGMNAPQSASSTPSTPQPCMACEDGTVYVAVAGGRWCSYLGNYEPDERPEPCEECRGTGYVYEDEA